MKKPKVGDKIFVVECGNKARYNRSQKIPPNSYYMEVVKVGRKYLYLGEGHRQIKVSINTILK